MNKLRIFLFTIITLITTSSFATLQSSVCTSNISIQKGKYVYLRVIHTGTSKSAGLYYYSTVAFVADDGSFGSFTDNIDKLKKRFLKIIATDYGIEPSELTKVAHYEYDNEKSANRDLNSSLPRPDKLIEL